MMQDPARSLAKVGTGKVRLLPQFSQFLPAFGTLSRSYEDRAEVDSGKGLQVTNVIAHANTALKIQIEIFRSSMQESG